MAVGYAVARRPREILLLEQGKAFDTYSGSLASSHRRNADHEPIAMTWVIGVSSIFGYGAMMSDVRVTFRDGRQRDLVQKAYAVGPYIVAGFAGSVKIGFQMLDSLANFLVVPPDAPQPGSWDPEWVAEHWKPIAVHVFARADAQEQALRCQILLVGMSQKIDPEVLANPRAVKTPHACVVRFSSPNFDPIIANKRLSVDHIGSGATVEHYTKMMQHHFDLGSDTLKAEMGALGMWPKMLGHSVARLVADHPIDGISPHVHILVCRNGEIFEMTNDEKRFPADGSEPIEFKMPAVAKNYQEFLVMCCTSAIAAEGAVA